MVSNASESWLGFENETNEPPTESVHRRFETISQCFLSLLDACRNFKSWWSETTDNVILNSPWLHRETGNAFRCAALFFLCAAWFHFLFYTIDGHTNTCWSHQCYMDYVVLMVLFFGFLFSLAAALQRQRESFRASLFYCFMISLNRYANGEWWHFRLWEEFRVLLIAVVLCHSNVHPLLLLLVTLILQIEIATIIWADAGPFKPFPQILNGTCGSFQLLLVCAFSQDFTNRVRAVSSGEIFSIVDEDPFESPLRGRSARRFCWLMGINSWVSWGTFMIGRAMQEGGHLHNAVLQNRLPICTWLAPCVLIAVMLWARQQCIVWKADLALLFCCLTPALLVAGDLILQIQDEACGSPGQPWPACNGFQSIFGAYMTMLCFMALPVLVQAGSHPLLCTVPCILLSVLFVGIEFRQFFSIYDVFALSMMYVETEVRVAAPLSWMVWLSHAIDYFKRMRAIRQGLERMRENAASSLSLLNNISVSQSTSGVELQVQHSSSGFQHVAQGPQPDVPEVSAVAVAVVRHAERADDMHAFDDWGCSQDAREFPFDPPITSNGVQQAKQLADDLKKQFLAVDLVVSSPYLRCLQTAEILAEEFDAVLLLDQELGEVLGPDVFEARPPTLVRSWKSTKSLCQTQRVKAGRAMGKKPRWPETLKDARVRYAKRFLDYLRRARRAKKSCILVTHGHMLQVCANILPATQHLKVGSVNYAAAILATCRQSDGSTAVSPGLLDSSGSADFGEIHHQRILRSASFDKAAEESVETDPGKAEETNLQGNTLLQDVNMKYWSVWYKGLRSTSGRAASMPPILRELQTQEEQLGMSWQDLMRLL